MSLFKLIVSIVFNVAIFAIPSVLARRHSGLVACLGDCRPGFVGGLASVVSLSHGHRALLEERLKPPVQKGQPLADKILLLLLFAAFLGLIVFTSLDVFRFHIMAELGTVVSSLGPVLFVAGWWIAYLSLREDAFASQVVRHQQERNQAVVDTGVYGIVRHPMYSGGLLLTVGVPLWLESYTAAMLASFPIGTLAVRILVEEQFLRRELASYDAYTERVRCRLIPFVW